MRFQAKMTIYEYLLYIATQLSARSQSENTRYRVKVFPPVPRVVHLSTYMAYFNGKNLRENLNVGAL